MVRAPVCIRSSLVIPLVWAFGVSCRSAGSDKSDAGAGVTPQATTTQAARIGSCDRVPTAGTCSEYAGAYLAEKAAFLTSTCGRLGGTFVYAECPNTSILGTCTLSTGEVRKFYATGGAPFDPDRARAECQTSLHGSWQTR